MAPKNVAATSHIVYASSQMSLSKFSCKVAYFIFVSRRSCPQATKWSTPQMPKTTLGICKILAARCKLFRSVSTDWRLHVLVETVTTLLDKPLWDNRFLFRSRNSSVSGQCDRRHGLEGGGHYKTKDSSIRLGNPVSWRDCGNRIFHICYNDGVFG